MALVSGDPLLQQLIKEGRDIHSETVRRVWPEHKDKSDDYIKTTLKKLRTISKVILFALVYGAAPKKMAFILDMPIIEATRILKLFKEDAYPVLTKWLDEQGKLVMNGKPVEILGGYKRRFVSTGTKWQDLGQVRSIVNSMIQGAGAYITKIGTLNVIKALRRESIEFKLIILIHDSITIQVADTDVQAAYSIIEKEMQFESNGLVLKCLAAVNKDMSKESEQSLEEFMLEDEDE